MSDRELVFWTGTGSGKVKRLRNDGRVEVVLCDVRGRVTPGALVLAGAARVLDEAGTDAARRLLARKYRLVRLTGLGSEVFRRPRPEQVGVAFTF